MSKSKQQYKQFSLDSIEEGMQALSSLIISVTVNLEKYREYASEIESLADKYASLNKEDDSEILIPAKEYDDVNDKLLYRQREIIKYIADHQSSSFSFINLRKYIVKHNYLERDLDKNIKDLLCELLDVRNWSFHNPQSMLVASKESAIKRLPKELSELIKIEPQLNPVIIDHITHYDLIMLLTLVIHSQDRIKQFELILDNMKKDYSEMYKRIPNKKFHFIDGELSKDILYQKLARVCRFVSVSSDMTQISMAIQKSEYDGSDEMFQKWVIKK